MRWQFWKRRALAWPPMRLLLDESVPAKLRRLMPSHEVRTVDKNMPFQQNLATLPIALIVLDALSNELQALSPLLPALERALASLAPNSYVLVRAEA